MYIVYFEFNKKERIIQKRIVFLLVYALIMSCILNMTYASDATTSHNIVDKITIKKENGEIGEFGLYERLYIHINWSAKRPLVKDEVYQIELPSEFKEKDTKIKILYGGDKEVGICEVKDNILFITFNEEVESIQDAKGEIILVRELKYEYYKEGESKLEFTFISAEKSWKVNVDFNVDKPANDEVIMKYGFSAYDEQGNEKLYWRQRINFNKQNL